MIRYIGVDLQKTQLTVCYLDASGEKLLRKFTIAEIDRFIKSLKKEDWISVEATTNTRWFVSQVKEVVEKVVVVNTNQFEVITKSVKKTDRLDATTRAFYLSKDLLPESRLKAQYLVEVQSLCHTKKPFVSHRSALMNKLHSLELSNGRVTKKSRFDNERGLREVLKGEFSKLQRLEVELLVEQIRRLTDVIKRLSKEIAAAAQAVKGYENLLSIKGIGSDSAALFLSVIGDVEDFADESKLASYFGIVPRVSDSNETIRHGKIHKRGSKLGRTTLAQCTLVAIKYSRYLREFYDKLKSKKGSGKAIIGTARKFLGIIYKTLKNDWVFADFGNWELVQN